MAFFTKVQNPIRLLNYWLAFSYRYTIQYNVTLTGWAFSTKPTGDLFFFFTGIQPNKTYRWPFFLQVDNPTKLTGGLFHTGTKSRPWSHSSDTEPWPGLGHTWPTKNINSLNSVSFRQGLTTYYNQSKKLQRKLLSCLTSGFLSSSSVFLTRSVFFC